MDDFDVVGGTYQWWNPSK